MLVYRVFAYDVASPVGTSGHADYVHRPAQGLLRLDNPNRYVTWYYGVTPEVAIGESFGDHAEWSDAMFETPWLPKGKRVLGTFEIPDDTPLLDLDDPRWLVFFRWRRGVHQARVISLGKLRWTVSRDSGVVDDVRSGADAG